MQIEVDIGVLVTVALAVVGAWWGLVTMAMKQFEKRQEERFASLQNSIDVQDGKQDGVMAEIRRVEAELSRAQIDAATRYQTKDDAGKQFGQVIQEIRALGARIDSFHVRQAGTQ